MTEPVAWDLAEKVAVRVGGRDPFGDSYHGDSLLPDFEELTRQAEELVTRETGLVPATGAARVRVVDRADWVHANIRSMRRLLAPLTEKVGDKLGSNPVASAVTPRIAALEMGTMLGWMSTRVLGQYDLLLVEDEAPEDQDLVYYVGPNVLSLEKRFGFPPREFRLWLALHEVTHRAQFTGVPWLRPHFLSLVEGAMGSVDPDPGRLVDALRRAVDEVRAGRNPLDEGGLVALLATDEQREVLDRMTAVMSLLEGHADVVMDGVGPEVIPTVGEIRKRFNERRKGSGYVDRVLRKLLGLDAKMAQYRNGAAFVRGAVDAVGMEGFNAVWAEPANLPTRKEIGDPEAWVRRVHG